MTTDSGSDGSTATNPPNAAVELLRTPFEFKFSVGNKTFVMAQEPALRDFLGLVPIGLLALGFLAMLRNQPATGTASHLVYEVGAVLIVLALLLVIAGGEAQQKQKRSETAGKRFRRWTRIGLGIVGIVLLVLAFQVSRQNTADFMITVGVATIAAVALDAIIVEPGEKLYAFSLAGTKTISVGANGKIEIRDRDPGRKKTLLERLFQISVVSKELERSATLR